MALFAPFHPHYLILFLLTVINVLLLTFFFVLFLIMIALFLLQSLLLITPLFYSTFHIIIQLCSYVSVHSSCYSFLVPYFCFLLIPVSYFNYIASRLTSQFTCSHLQRQRTTNMI